jgi:DNA helicase-2/ATP-dependent DNA helicase PcrA
MFIPRPKQQEILAYQGGKMGISAVPGSGKTQILSLLAAQIIASGILEDEQEVLIVTLVNSAVDNFAIRVGDLIKERGLLPNLGYRVRTLHGLAHDIVRERPDLLGLSEDFQIIDERDANQIREGAALAWLKANPYALDDYLDSELEEGKLDWVRRDRLPRMISDVALAIIRLAKDQERTPEDLRARLEQLPVQLPLAQMGCEIYQAYQQALLYRGALDFDDLIRLALQAIRLDENYLERLSNRWPYILEDEAQDSSRLQEAILNKLSAFHGNWVRVGDPNQAIFETFTTADPKHLREFLDLPTVTNLEMPNSGRSTSSIIDLANYLIDCVLKDHPREEVREALVPPPIEGTPPGDPQPNPPDDPRGIRLVDRKLTPQQEIQFVAESLSEWIPTHSEETVAVLVPRNQRGFELVDELRRRKIEFSDTLLGITSATRGAVGALANVLNYLSEPGSAKKLAKAYQVWRRENWKVEEYRTQLDRAKKLLNGCRQLEEYLWPRAGRDWLASLALRDDDNWISEELDQFRQIVHRWHGATLLPIDQLIIALAQDLFQEPADIATAHKLAVLMRRVRDLHQDWRLPEFTEELAIVARNKGPNKRRFLGFSEDDTGFDPKKYKGKVVVATMHKSKGLEWDRVYLMSVNNYDFPSGQPDDRYISEPWFLRDHLNLDAETIDQLQVALSSGEYDWYEEGRASRDARLGYVSERLRLLYVGITRAKRELILTWNTGRDGALRPAEPFQALLGYWEERLADLGEEPV